jgi:hypothetical protein
MTAYGAGRKDVIAGEEGGLRRRRRLKEEDP